MRLLTDGVLTRKIAEQLKDGTGIIWGIDSSPAMIETANHHVPDVAISNRRHGYSVMDATKLFDYLQGTDLSVLDRQKLGIDDSSQLIDDRYTKIFSNAALHWSVLPLRSPSLPHTRQWAHLLHPNSQQDPKKPNHP